MVALLFLLDGSRLLSRLDLARAAAAVFGCRVCAESRDSEADDGLVAGDPPSMVLALRGRVILVHSLSRPYFPDPAGAIERSADPRLHRAIRAHGSWFSLDLVEGLPAPSPRQALAELAAIASRLVSSDTLAFGLPEQGRLAPAPADLAARLGETNLDELLLRLTPRAARVRESVEDFAVASSEARRRWNEFVEAFARRADGHCFAVRSGSDWDHPQAGEWLFVSELHPDHVVAHRDPLLVANARIEVPTRRIADWIVRDDRGVRGAFTTEVVGRRLARRATGLD